jgi:hypothetical protein
VYFGRLDFTVVFSTVGGKKFTSAEFFALPFLDGLSLIARLQSHTRHVSIFSLFISFYFVLIDCEEAKRPLTLSFMKIQILISNSNS